MADLTNPHDKFFRSSMQNAPINRAFFKQYLPDALRNVIDFSSFELQDTTNYDNDLHQTMSDLVFNCRYSQKGEDGSKEAKIILLVEHQSTADELMPFRVYHYLFNTLYKHLKLQADDDGHEGPALSKKLPVIYAMVFYHGTQTPWPYSLNIADCFDDPHRFMDTYFKQDIPLIDVNEVQDDDLKQQQLLGIMTGALKHSRDRDIKRYLLKMMETLNKMDLSNDLTLQFLKTLLNYLFGVGNTNNVKHFIEQSWRLPKPVRGELMTIAEQLKAMGHEEGLEKGHKEGALESRRDIAIQSLKANLAPELVAQITRMDLADVLKLKSQLYGAK